MAKTNRFVYEELAEMVRAFEQDSYKGETADFLIQLIYLHPSSADKKYQDLVDRVKQHPQRPRPSIEINYDRVLTLKELKGLIQEFREGPYSEEVTESLLQLINSHPFGENNNFRNLKRIISRHPQRFSRPVKISPDGSISYEELHRLVQIFEESSCNYGAASSLLIEVITSQPSSSGRNYRKLIGRVKQIPKDQHPVLKGLPTSHYFSMSKQVESVERRYNQKHAQEILAVIRERIPADDRYSHLARRVEYAITVNGPQASSPKKGARQRKRQRQLEGWRDVAPRGLGTESTQRLMGGWRTISGGLPDA